MSEPYLRQPGFINSACGPLTKNKKTIKNLANFADLQVISTFSKEFRFLLCATDIYSKYAWVIPLLDKKRYYDYHCFLNILDESVHKPNKICIDNGKEFYNTSMKSLLGKNDIEMFSTHNDGKPVVADRFIKTLKNKIYKHMTSV